MQSIYKRIIEKDLVESIGKKPILILYGARQVGKTTLVKKIISKYKNPLYLQLDSGVNRQRVEDKSIEELKSLIDSYDIVIFDEAQKVKDIGTILKLIADNVKGIPVIATGSSSFELANKLSEPLTGRNRKFTMFPLSIPELAENYGPVNTENLLEQYIIYGTYPEVVANKGLSEKKRVLEDLAKDYLYKDLFQLGGIKNTFAFEKLVQLLALRVGSEIVYEDLARELKISAITVQHYVDLLEQAFIVFRLRPIYKNREKEIVKNHKIYFFDTGIRNAVLGTFDDLDLRLDKGFLFENFCISEMYKSNIYGGNEKKMFFWRGKQGGEVDLVMSNTLQNKITAFEFKWKDDAQAPSLFRDTFKPESFQVVTIKNFLKILKIN